MYELSVERVFCAAHAIVIAGRREPVHGHTWRVVATVQGSRLDPDGLLCDFHLIERELDRLVGPWSNADLNTTAPFDEMNPTAEHVARHVGESLTAALPRGVRLASVSVTEAPGCVATYRPEHP